MNFWLNLSKPVKIIFVGVLVVFIALGAYLLLWSKSATVTPQLKDFSKQPRPAPILPAGKQIYEVIQQDFTYQPKIRFVSLDPVDPKPGEEQKITVQIDAYSKPTTVSVAAGSGTKEIPLKELQGKTLNLTRRYFVGEDNNLVSYSGQKIYREEITNKFNRQAGIGAISINESTSTYVGPGPAPTSTKISAESKPLELKTDLKTYEFSGSWKADGNYSNSPSLSILVKEESSKMVKVTSPEIAKLVKEKGEKFAYSYAKKNNIKTFIDKPFTETLYSNASFGWSTSCQSPLGGNWELSEQCAVTYLDGSDGGNILISQTGKMVSDADLVVNPGKSIVFSRDGQIIINTSKSIKESYLWKKVTDRSGVEEIVAGSKPKGEYFRRYMFNSEDPEFRGLNANGQIYIVPKGKQQFSVSGGDPNAPKIIQVDIDPLDVRPGDVQKMKIVVQSGNGISEVKAKIETDKGYVDVPLSFEGKTAEADIVPNPYFVNERNELVIAPVKRQAEKLAESSIIKTTSADAGDKLTYSGSWLVKDTIAKKYRTTFIVKDSAQKENSITMAWSDPCGTAYSYQDSLYTSNCTTYGTQGNARGNLTIGRVSPAANPTITLQNGGNLFVSTGYSISLVGTSKIVVNTGAQIRISYVSAVDQDQDGYAVGNITLTDTAPTGYYRDLKTTNESWADCVDSDAAVHPGASGSTEPGSNGWDWNCDGYITMNTTVFSASCDGDNGCAVCTYYYLYCESTSCAYGGYTAGVAGGSSCGCWNDWIDGCTSGGGPGIGGCDYGSCSGYYPNVVDSVCIVCG
jgi:hypothetical protein